MSRFAEAGQLKFMANLLEIFKHVINNKVKSKELGRVGGIKFQTASVISFEKCFK